MEPLVGEPGTNGPVGDIRYKTGKREIEMVHG